MGFFTDAIHAGQEPDPATGAVSVPIYQTSTYAQIELGRDKGFDYARSINPTRLALERSLAALEGGKSAYAFSSGMAAITTVMMLLKAGDHVVSSANTYGGTYRLFVHILQQFGISFSFVDTSRMEEISGALRPETRLVYVETPTNPMMEITDLEAVAALCRKRNLISVCDNTFMSPYLQRPLALGFDIVVHSTTKFINGHSDSVGGAVITTRPEHGERIGFAQNSVGAILGPMDSFLVLRGVKTLGLRMQRHDANGRALAAFLADHPGVGQVYYPGLPDHPGHELAVRQMDGFGGMIAFDLGSLEASRAFLNGLRVFTLAESLGGVESLACHPVSMTHAAVPREDRLRMGLTDGLARLSVGIEDLEDLQEDVERGLAAIKR
ncbi:MAG: PLP-dependent aspartate aminotransferase family protein [Acidobacteria bacterium]|nr:PLP-dependent aspartate aminotransferase family protein [Acidobacteriota bacterium]